MRKGFNGIVKFFKTHALVRLLIIAGALYVAAFFGTGYLREQKMKGKLLAGLEVEEYDEYMESLKDEPSDIEGKSKYDKYKMGLDYRDGSDTDHDGLSDKEEIEVYGTDPLKSSTAGDLYSDGYKVANGLALDEKLDYTEDIVFANNSCDEVQLEADQPEDLLAVVEDYTDRYSLSDYGIKNIYKGYWVYNYSGTLCIDLKEILSSNDVQPGKVSIYIYKGDFLINGISDLEECKFELDGNVATLDYDFTNDEAYYVYVAEPTNLINKLFTNAKDAVQMKLPKEKDSKIFVLGNTFAQKYKVFYPKQETKEETEMLISNMKKIYEKADKKHNVEFIEESPVKINSLRDFLRKYISSFEAPDNAGPFPKEKWYWFWLFYYETYDNKLLANADFKFDVDSYDETLVKYNNYHTSFDPNVDEFPFQNFGSEYNANGNCAGITNLTAYLFNNGSFPTSGSYNGVDWDLNTDDDNETLTDAGLSDYKYRDFVDDNKVNGILDRAKLTNGENEFVKMMYARWQESNDRNPLSVDYSIKNSDWSNDWELAERMMSYLDQGKILDVSMQLRDGSGHAVNVYDYYFLNESELIFRVYDNNLPQSQMSYWDMNCEGACYLQCKKVVRSDGSYGFKYLYYPVKGELNYMATSNGSLMTRSILLVADENWNLFN